MSEELTKNQKNLVNVLNYCLETKHDFNGPRSNKLTKEYARDILNCMSLPDILKEDDSANFQEEILSEFGLDVDSIQRDSYMESEMVSGVFLNPKTYNSKVNIEDSLSVWAYNHSIKFKDADDGATVGLSGTMPEKLYKCKIMMGELELDKDDVLEADKIYEHVMTFLGDRKVIVDTIPNSFNYIYNRIMDEKSKQPFTKDWDPATLKGKPLQDTDLSFGINDANDVRKIYNEEGVNTLKSFSKKILNIVPVYSDTIDGNNQTTDCSDKDKTGNNYCIIRKEGDSIPENSQLLLLFNSSEEDSDFSFKNEQGQTVNYSLPYDIGDGKKTHITSGFSVKELSSGIGLLVRLRRNDDAFVTDFTQTECDKIKSEIQVTFDKANKLSQTGLRLCWNIIDSIFKNQSDLKYKGNDSLTVDDALQYGILIMLDLKKAGDWGLVDYCNRTDSVLLTLDRLCGLYALIKNVSVLFSGSFYTGYKTWVLYNGNTSVKVKTKFDIIQQIGKNIKDFNISNTGDKTKLFSEMAEYRSIMDENCDSVENFKPKSNSKFKGASMKYEYLKNLLEIYDENNIIIDESISSSSSLHDYIDSFISDIDGKLSAKFGGRDDSLYSTNSFIRQSLIKKKAYLLSLVNSIANDQKYKGPFKSIIIDGNDADESISDDVKFQILLLAKNIIINTDDIFNLVRFINYFYKPSNSRDCNPDYHNLLYNYQMRVLGIFLYPKSRQTILGKKFVNRSNIADKNQEITRAFEENIHRSRNVIFDSLRDLDLNLGWYESQNTIPFWEIFSKQIDLENSSNEKDEDEEEDKRNPKPEIVNEFEDKVFKIGLVNQYLNSISDRERTTVLNNLVSSFNLLHENTYPGKAVVSIIKINKFLKTKGNILSKIKSIDLVDGEIKETMEEIDIPNIRGDIELLKDRLYNKNLENGILNTILFITHFIEACKKSLLDSYSDIEQVHKFLDNISLITDEEFLLKDLVLVLFNDDITDELPDNGEYSQEQSNIINEGIDTLNSWMDEINEDYESDNFEIYIDTKFEAFIKNFEDLMHSIHYWRDTGPTMGRFCKKFLKSFMVKYPFIDQKTYNSSDVDDTKKDLAKSCQKSLSEAYSSYAIKSRCSPRNGVNVMKSLAVLLILLNNDRNRAGQIKSKKVYEGIFFAKDPAIMRRINNLENIQRNYINILQDVYNMSQNLDSFDKTLIPLTGWDKTLNYKNCSNIDKLFSTSVQEEPEVSVDLEDEITSLSDSQVIEEELLDIDSRIGEINSTKPKIQAHLQDLKADQQYEIATTSSEYNLYTPDDSDDSDENSIDFLYKIGRKGMRNFIKDYTSTDTCSNNRKSDCDSNSDCTWINYDYANGRKKITGTECMETSKFRKLPQSNEEDCCSPIRVSGCAGMNNCIDANSEKYESGFDYSQFGGNSGIEEIIILESQLEELDEELEFLNYKKNSIIANNISNKSLRERIAGVKTYQQVSNDRKLYDINCEDIDLENCDRDDDELFRFCKKSDDNKHCDRDNNTLLRLEFIETGDIDNFGEEERLNLEQLRLIKYLVMNINLYDNCLYGSKINSLARNSSNSDLITTIKDYLNTNIASETDDISTNIDLVDYILSTINSIEQVGDKLKAFISENTHKDESERIVLKKGRYAHDVIKFLSGLSIELIEDPLISRFIKFTISDGYTNTCSLDEFKKGSKNIFDSVNNLENISDFTDEEVTFMINVIKSVNKTFKNGRFENADLNEFFITRTRGDEAEFRADLEKLRSQNKEDFISDGNFVGKLNESLDFVDIDGNILEDSPIYDEHINKYSQIIGLVDKLNFYMEYYPEIMKQLRTQSHLLVDSKLYFEDMIILPYMNAAYLLMLYYPVIEYIVNDKYI